MTFIHTARHDCSLVLPQVPPLRLFLLPLPLLSPLRLPRLRLPPIFTPCEAPGLSTSAPTPLPLFENGLVPAGLPNSWQVRHPRLWHRPRWLPLGRKERGGRRERGRGARRWWPIGWAEKGLESA